MSETETTKDWRWLRDTFWYVDERWLPALQLDPAENRLAWKVDQTVWRLTGYRDGYLWGVSSALVLTPGETAPSSRPTLSTIVGSITPEGTVHLTFVRPTARTSAPVLGLGRMSAFRGRPTFEMQMSTTAPSGDVLVHWAHMLRVGPDDPEWESLPGVGLSVEQMLAGAEPPTVEGG